MYLWMGRKRGKQNRKKCARHRAKAKAKNRRRINGMHGRRLGRRLRKSGVTR